MGSKSNAMLGLSGLDTAGMLKAMMRPYKNTISSLSQKQQVVVWKQERYRDLITKLNDFRSKFFDYRNPATNISSTGTWRQYNVENSGNEYVKISSTANSRPKSGTVELEKMPTASVISGGTDLMKDVQGLHLPD